MVAGETPCGLGVPEAPRAPQAITLDPIMPAAMAVRAEETGIRRAAMDPMTLLVLSVLAGAFISFGAIFATTVSAGSIAVTTADGAPGLVATLPYGVVRLLQGLVFSVGLILVVIAVVIRRTGPGSLGRKNANPG